MVGTTITTVKGLSPLEVHQFHRPVPDHDLQPCWQRLGPERPPGTGIDAVPSEQLWDTGGVD